MKFTKYHLLILLVGTFYLNSNIFVSDPIGSYKEYRTNSSIDDIIKKYRKQKTTHSVIIDAKAEVISDITNSPKIPTSTKHTIIAAIIKIKIIVVSLKNDNYIALKNMRGIYVRSEKYRSHFIIIDESIIIDPNARYTILHELYHLVDDEMVVGPGMYSDNNIKPLGITVLDSTSINLKVEKLLELYFGVGGKQIPIGMRDNAIKLHSEMTKYISHDANYICSYPEVYARMRIARKYLRDHGQIEHIDQALTKANFVYLFSPEVLLAADTPQFFELLFFMDIDIGIDKRYIQINNLELINAIL